MKGSILLKLYLIVSGVVFLLVGLFHLFRLIHHWPIIVGGTPIPPGLSYVGFPFSTCYALGAFWLLRNTHSAPFSAFRPEGYNDSNV